MVARTCCEDVRLLEKKQRAKLFTDSLVNDPTNRERQRIPPTDEV